MNLLLSNITALKAFLVCNQLNWPLLFDAIIHYISTFHHQFYGKTGERL